MGQCNQEAVELFKNKAKLASIEIAEVKNLAEAIDRAADICAAVDASASSAEKVMAAPALTGVELAAMEEACAKRKLEFIQKGLRSRLAGIEAAFTLAQGGIAETATSILPSLSEELRLATMICETHIVALPKSKVLMDSYEFEEQMRGYLKEEAMYAAFISGPSRTADIERVLTIGVHGPVAMHVLLMDEE